MFIWNAETVFLSDLSELMNNGFSDVEMLWGQTSRAIMSRNKTIILTHVNDLLDSMAKYIAYSSSLDMPIEKLESFLMGVLDIAEADGFAVLLNEQKTAMDDFWQAADIQIDGDEALQQGLRFNLFHIMQSSGRDGKTGMGAKGLSGEGYEGHYFWDTEMYVLPVFIWTNPELAKQLLLYRYHTLPQARERAKVLGHPIGALYPWRTINGEEASTYFPLGTAQYHINGDIAYAVWQYYEATGDYDFLRDYGAEMLVETARVFADVGGFADCRGGKYCICAVTGPDEYNAIVDNNLYTNLLAQENLYAALRSLEILGEDSNKLSSICSIHASISFFFQCNYTIPEA